LRRFLSQGRVRRVRRDVGDASSEEQASRVFGGWIRGIRAGPEADYHDRWRVVSPSPNFLVVRGFYISKSCLV
jgi:hypothetical protein